MYLKQYNAQCTKYKNQGGTNSANINKRMRFMYLKQYHTMHNVQSIRIKGEQTL